MNMTSRILVAGMVIALAGCGKSTQSDVDNVARDHAEDAAKAAQAAQPAIDAANRDLAKARSEASTKRADANADANRGVSKAALNQYKEQAKADYAVALARADGDLSVALEKCRMLSADAKNLCEQNAHSLRDQSGSAAKEKLDFANRQAG